MALSSFYFPLLLSFMLLPLCVTSQRWNVGATLSTDNFPWLSPSRDFAFGFNKINETTYLLAIWYAKIPDTIVWYAGLDGVLAPKGSNLTLIVDQGLVLSNPQGDRLWASPNVSAGAVRYCFLNDTGNLVVKDIGNKTLWQSFDDPRDTLLPTQKFRALTFGLEGPKVYSKHSKANFTRGKFQLRLLSDGNLVLNTRSVVTDFAYDNAYYISGTFDPADPSNSGYMVSYDVSGHMYILRKNGRKVDLIGDIVPSPAEDYYFRVTLNTDGVFVWYYSKRNENSTWSVMKSIPGNICVNSSGTMDSGICGYNSICQLVTDGDYPRPKCGCPPRYSLLDPNDAYGSCKPDFKQGSGEENGYRLEPLPRTNWPNRDYDKLNPSSEDDCKNFCLNDFNCAAVVFNTEAETCWKKGPPLINGRKDDNDAVTTAFLKVNDANDNSAQNSIPPVPNVSKHRKGMNPLISSLLGTSIFVNLVLFGATLGILFHRSRHHRASHMVQKPARKWNHINCYDYKELEEATNDFKEELGRGACAIVYKGLIGSSVDGSQVPVAVKKIDRGWLREADNELKTELNVIGQTHHKNLVRLIGFCEDEKHRLLVYEFMSNGCLADLLFGEARPSWEVRIRIAQGTAKGLLYLHEECSSQIIHCDIKPQNILLDEFLEPHISDFGLSKLLMLNQFQTRTAVRGTKGYIAPEWFNNKPVTVKVDVYSYGVVLLEIMSCRRCVNMEASEEGKAILTDWAFDCYQMGNLKALVIDDVEALDDKESLERFVKVALWCAQEDPKLRPTMRQVTLMLEGFVEVPDPPCPTQDSFSVVSY